MSTLHDTTFSPLTLKRRQEAIDIAQFIIDKCEELDTSGRQVLGVELFGSLARGNVTESSDLDLIVVVEGFAAARWLKEFEERMGAGFRYDSGIAKQVRRQLALDYLGYDDLADTSVDFSKTDIFIFPPEWRKRGFEIRFFWPGWKDSFFKSLEHDAIPFVSNQGFPFPLKQREALPRDPEAAPTY